MRRAAFAIAAALCLTGPAFAVGEECQEPYGPVLPDPATVTKADLRAVKAEVEAFIADSDAYQSCLLHLIDNPAKPKDGGLTDSQKASLQRRINANQKEKETIGNTYNQLVAIAASRGN